MTKFNKQFVQVLYEQRGRNPQYTELAVKLIQQNKFGRDSEFASTVQQVVINALTDEASFETLGALTEARYNL